MIPTFSRTFFGSFSTSYPAILTLPDVIEIVVVRMDIEVDFPAPFGPRNAKNSPSFTENLTPSNAGVFALLFDKLH